MYPGNVWKIKRKSRFTYVDLSHKLTLVYVGPLSVKRPS